MSLFIWCRHLHCNIVASWKGNKTPFALFPVCVLLAQACITNSEMSKNNILMNLSERQEAPLLTRLYSYITSYVMTNVLPTLACSISALSCRCRMASMTPIFIGLCEYLMNFFPAQIILAALLMFASTLTWKKRLFCTSIMMLIIITKMIRVLDSC